MFLVFEWRMSNEVSKFGFRKKYDFWGINRIGKGIVCKISWNMIKVVFCEM